MDRQSQQTNDKFRPYSSHNFPVYHGLINHGATCYLNSVLQVLFRTREFREAVERYNAEDHKTKCFEFHLKSLFEDLKKRNQVSTFNIRDQLGIKYVYKRQDPAEVFEKILTSLTRSEASQIFQGELAHLNKCSKCNKKTETHKQFWTLPLELVDPEKKDYNVVDGIEKFFRESHISGDNQMYCDFCRTKHDATIKCVMKQHPEVLTLLLKRFKFDNTYRRYVKVRCSVDVPRTLQIPENQAYELYGFVDLRGGHYTATIKSQDGEGWYNFNDTIVTKLPDNQQLQMDNIMRSSSAYLLFYRKQKETSEGGEVSTKGGSKSEMSLNKKKENCENPAEEGVHDTVGKLENKMKGVVDDQKGKQEQDSVCVNKDGEEKKPEVDVKKEKESTTGDSEKEKGCIAFCHQPDDKPCQMNNNMSSAYPPLNRQKKDTSEGGEVSTKGGSKSEMSHSRKRENDKKAAEGYPDIVDKQEKKKKREVDDQEAYNGLINLGATCYLNSVLQLLFRTREFREAVERYNADDPKAECFELHLATLFEDLKRYKTSLTYNITNQLGIENVYERQDPAVVFEKILTSLTRSEASQMFQGELAHLNKCSKCNKTTESRGPFWTLPLELVDSDKKDYNVVDGIEKFFRESHISGDNQMYCDDCETKCDATMKCVMKQHPEVLTLLLKRFKFDNTYRCYIKVSCSVDVPRTLQIPENQAYELYGFVDHFGDLRGGHYTATIKSQDGEGWYNFNDTMVTKLPDNQQRRMDNMMRSSSAYLLFYRKQKETSQDKEVSTKGGFQSVTSHGNEQCDVNTRKRENDEKPAEEGNHHIVDKQEKKKKREVDDQEAYNGLINLGATCYLNSVLQLLFRTREFREAVERYNADDPKAECFELHLATLFEDLKRYKTSLTYNITNQLGIENVYEHRDAAEYFEKILTRLTRSEASQMFQGELAHLNKCSKCNKTTESRGPFWTLPLELVDSDKKDYNVVDGIEKFFRESHISGDNQMYCDDCETKCDATMKCVMKQHPEVLTLLLKRFKFDNTYRRYVKVRCSVDVPRTLQIPENQTYELYGFVDHFGDLRGGHYTATIKSQDGEGWYNFNDTMVTKLSEYQQRWMENTMRSSSAYLLFYRKQKDTSEGREVSTKGGSQSVTSHGNEQCDVNTRKRENDEKPAEEGNHHIVDKQENKKKVLADYQEGKQEQESVCLDKHQDDIHVKDVKVDEDKTTRDGERENGSGSRKLLTKFDLLNYELVSGRTESMLNNQGVSNTPFNRHELQTEEKMDVKEEKQQVATKMGLTCNNSVNVDVVRQVRSELQCVHLGKKEDKVEKEFREVMKLCSDNSRVGDVRQNKPSYEQEDKKEISDKSNVSRSYLLSKEGNRVLSSEGVENQPQEGRGQPEQFQTGFQNSNTNTTPETTTETSEGMMNRPLNDDERESDPKGDVMNNLSELFQISLQLNDPPPPGLGENENLTKKTEEMLEKDCGGKRSRTKL